MAVDWNAAVGWLIAIAGVIGAVSAISVVLQKVFAKAVQKELAQTNVKLDLMRGDLKSVSEQVNRVEYEARKNFLVSTLRELDPEKPLDAAMRARFYENYDAYRNAGGNSYIKEEVERAQASGLL